MKILAINWQDWEAPQRGGAEFYLKEILEKLVEYGHQVTLLSSGYPGSSHLGTLGGIKIVRTGSRNTFNFSIYGRSIRNFLRNNDFDVVIDDLNKIPFYTPLWAGSIPVVGMVMHVFRKQIFVETNLFAGSYVYITEKLIPRVYKRNIFGTLGAAGRRELGEMGMSLKHITVLEVGVNPIFKSGGKKKDNLIVSVGRLMRYKCVDHVLYAVANLKKRGIDVKCEIAGTGPYRSKLKELVDELGIYDSVDLLGWVSLPEVVKLYQKATVAVQPSAKEGWGFLATDAGACATPVVAARVPGLSDSVIDKKTGFLYEHGNIDEMADYLEMLLKDKKLAKKMGEANKKWASSLTWDKVARRVEEMLYSSVKRGELT